MRIVLGIFFVLVLGTVWLIYKAFVLDEPRLVDKLDWTDTTVTAFNSAGVALWTHNFPEAVRDRTGGILSSMGRGSGDIDLPMPGEGILHRLRSLPSLPGPREEVILAAGYERDATHGQILSCWRQGRRARRAPSSGLAAARRHRIRDVRANKRSAQFD